MMFISAITTTGKSYLVEQFPRCFIDGDDLITFPDGRWWERDEERDSVCASWADAIRDQLVEQPNRIVLASIATPWIMPDAVWVNRLERTQRNVALRRESSAWYKPTLADVLAHRSWLLKIAMTNRLPIFWDNDITALATTDWPEPHPMVVQTELF